MSTIDHTASEKRDVYATVTAQIITAIENGVGTWRMPWHTSGRFAFSPINVVSKKPYRGINTVCLWAAAQAKGYERGEWATYQQWQERGGQVRKGEKATTVVFWKFANDSAGSDDGDESPRGGSHLLFTRGYAVFNAAQVDGYTPKVDADATMPERIAHADSFFQSVGADLRHGGNQAFYSPASDHIQMPPFAAFAENVSYYSVLAHEHTHWTARAGRCDRELGKRFGDNAYAAEELIAELGGGIHVRASWAEHETPRGSRPIYSVVAEGPEGRQAGDLHGGIEGATGLRLADLTGRGIGPHVGGGRMTARHRISMPPLLANGIPRTWESEKRTAQRWHLFAETCRSLAADGLDYSVSLALTGPDPHILITASGNATRKPRPIAAPKRGMVQPVKSAQCAIHAQEAEWFLPENRERRNANTTHWRTRAGRYAELDAMAEDQLRAELEYWRELELISGQREHFKPGRTDETARLDYEVAA